MMDLFVFVMTTNSFVKEMLRFAKNIVRVIVRFLKKLDKALDELQSIHRDNKHLTNQLSKAMLDKVQSEKRSELLSGAWE